MSNPWNNIFNRFLSRFIYEYNATLYGFTQFLGKSQQYISKIRNNELPAIETHEKIINVLNLSVEDATAMRWSYIESKPDLKLIVDELLLYIDSESTTKLDALLASKIDELAPKKT